MYVRVKRWYVRVLIGPRRNEGLMYENLNEPH